jgi:hypothetical protein
MQSVPIITNVVSLNPAPGKVYSIQHYVIKFVSDLQQVSGFLWGTLTSSAIKTDHHIVESDVKNDNPCTLVKTLYIILHNQYIYIVGDMKQIACAYSLIRATTKMHYYKRNIVS